MRGTWQLMALALALTAASACSDSTSARLMAPGDADAVKASNNPAPLTYTSAAGVTATTYDGNTRGEGGAACSALGFGSTGTKVDGAYSQSIAGYRFTVSGDKQSLSFAPIGSGTPTTSILAVIVKGATGYNVYAYSAGQTTDAGLISPRKNGGIPAISHYVACYGPRPPVLFTKRLVGVMKEGPPPSLMEDDLDWQSHPDLVIIPWGKTRWLDYEISYTLPPGVTGTVTENANDVCGSLGTFVMQCSFNESPVTFPVYSWSGLSGTGSFLVMIDLGGGGGPSCGDHEFINTAKLTTSTGAVYTTSHRITVRGLCP